MRAPLALMLVVCALAAGCATSDPATRVVVPNLRGRTDRDVTCQLQGLGLRWRFRGAPRAQSRPSSECGNDNVGGSMDDIPVTGQTPRPGVRVRRGSVIVIDDMCTDAARQGAGCA